MRARFDADVISALRGRVISHNSAVGEAARTRLQELKKIYAGGYRGSTPEENAMKAVDRHLDLRKVGDDFDESKHRRDSDGKFAPKGGSKAPKYGQNRAFADVNTQRRHESLKSRNAGYQAFQTDVIPETRYSAYLPAALAAGMAGTTALAWAVPEQRDELYRLAQRGLVPVARTTGQIAGRLAGATGVATVRGAQKLGGRPPISDKKALSITEAVADRAGRILGGATDKAMTVYQDVTSAANHALVNAARGPTPKGKNFAAMRRRFRAELRGRGVGALGGALVSIPSAYGAYKLGEFVGPMVDAWAPRRVEKIDSPEINEVLAKVASGAGEEELLKAWAPGWKPNPGKLMARAKTLGPRMMRAAMAPSVARAQRKMSSVSAPQVPDLGNAAGIVKDYASELYDTAGKIGRRAAESVVRRAGGLIGREAFGSASMAAGALGGAAAGAGAGYGAARAIQGNPYRDEEGKFTSKEKAAFIIGGAAAGGLAAYAAMRRGNAKGAQALYERMGGTTSLPKSKTGTRALADAVSGENGDGALRITGMGRDERLTGFSRRAAERIQTMATNVAKAERQSISKYIKNKLDFEGEIHSKIDRSLGQHLRSVIGTDDFLNVDNLDGAAKKTVADLVEKAKKKKIGITGLESELNVLGPKQKAAIKELRDIAEREKTSVSKRIEALRNGPADKIAENEKLARELVKKNGKIAELEDFIKNNKLSKDTLKGATDELDKLKSDIGEIGKKSKALEDEIQKAGNIAENLKPKDFDEVLQGKAPGETTAARVESYIKNIRGVFDKHITVSDPFNSGKKISVGLDGESIKADIEDTIRKYTGQFTKVVANANIASANHAVNLLNVAREGFKPISMPVVSRDVDAFARKVGGRAADYIDQARSDIQRGASAIMREAGFAGGNLRNKIDEAYQVGKDYATTAKTWVKDNGWYYGKLGALGLSSVGIIDYGADGRVRWLGIDKAKIPEITPYIDLANIGQPGKETATYGITAVTGKDGTERFLIGDQDRSSRRFDYEGSVAMGAKVKDVEAAVRNQGDGKGGGKPKSIDNKDWNKVQEAFKKLGRDNAYKNIDDIQYTTRNDIGDEQNIVRRGLRQDANQAQNFGEKLQIVMRGGGSKILTLNQRADLLVGNEKHPGGIFGRDAFEAYNEGKFGVLADIVKKKANEGVRGDLLKTSLKILGRAKGQNDDLPAFQQAFEYIDGVRGSGGGGGGFNANPGGGGKKWWDLDGRADDYVPFKTAKEIEDEWSKAFVTGSHRNLMGDGTTEDRYRTFQSLNNRALREIYNRARIEVPREESEDDQTFHSKRWSMAQNAVRRMFINMTRGEKPSFDKAWEDYQTKNTADLATDLLKFDESKIKRQGKGSDKGGEFAPKAGGMAPSSSGMPKAPPQASQDSFWEPRRLGQTLGSGIGMQVAFDIADRHLPAAKTGKMQAVRLAAKMASSLVGGYFGGKAGDTIGGQSYLLRGKGAQAPNKWEEPERPGGEVAARLTGNFAGWGVGMALSGRAGLLGRATAGALAGIGAEEMAASAYNHVSSRYGDGMAARVSRWL